MNHSSQSRTTVDRDQLVLAHVGMVRSVARRLSQRLPKHVEVADLVGVGSVALVDAAGRYRPALGVPFNAFARPRVQGAMLDSLRDLDWKPRSLREKQRALDRAIQRLRHQLQREPDAVEIAAELRLPEKEYDRLLEEVRMAELATIRLAGGASDSLLDVAIDTNDSQYVILERAELVRRVAEALTSVPDRERRVLALYFEEEMTLGEIGEVLGVSESRASQLRTQAIARLRTLLRGSISKGEPS